MDLRFSRVCCFTFSSCSSCGVCFTFFAAFLGDAFFAGGGGGELSEEMKAEMEEQRRLLEQMQKDKDEYAEKLAA